MELGDMTMKDKIIFPPFLVYYIAMNRWYMIYILNRKGARLIQAPLFFFPDFHKERKKILLIELLLFKSYSILFFFQMFFFLEGLLKLY